MTDKKQDTNGTDAWGWGPSEEPEAEPQKPTEDPMPERWARFCESGPFGEDSEFRMPEFCGEMMRRMMGARKGQSGQSVRSYRFPFC